MKVLGLDIGDRRIGVAASDASGTLAFPLEVVVRTSTQKAIARVLSIAGEQGAEVLVAGMPLSIDGSEGPQARKVQRFLRALREATSVPVETVDERYSSFEAERLLRQQGRQPSRQRGMIDAAAAAILLQDYLDQHKKARCPNVSG